MLQRTFIDFQISSFVGQFLVGFQQIRRTHRRRDVKHFVLYLQNGLEIFEIKYISNRLAKQTLKVFVFPAGSSSNLKTASLVSGLTSMSSCRKFTAIFLSRTTFSSASAYFLTPKRTPSEVLNITLALSLLLCCELVRKMSVGKHRKNNKRGLILGLLFEDILPKCTWLSEAHRRT